MNDAAAVHAVRDLALESQGTITVDGKEYWKQTRELVVPIQPLFLPETLNFVTLTGLAAYLTGEPDVVEGLTKVIDAKTAYLHVEDFDKVSVLSAPQGDKRVRHRIAQAKSPVSLDFPFGKFMPLEELTIKLRTQFVRNEALDEIVQMLTKVDISNGVTQADDGISQGVQIKKGISGANVEGKTNRGLYRLAPRRTFDEAQQAESEFLFRLKIGDGAEAALFQSGGNEWRLAAIQNVRTWLQGNLPGWKVLA